MNRPKIVMVITNDIQRGLQIINLLRKLHCQAILKYNQLKALDAIANDSDSTISCVLIDSDMMTKFEGSEFICWMKTISHSIRIFLLTEDLLNSDQLQKYDAEVITNPLDEHQLARALQIQRSIKERIEKLKCRLLAHMSP